MDRTLDVAAAVVTAWTRLYTARMAPGVRDGRRAEIASDLWEHAHAPSGTSSGPAILWRCVSGVPADIAWRFETATVPALQAAGAGALARTLAAGRWSVNRGLPGATGLLVALYVVVGIVMLATIPAVADTDLRERAWQGSFLVVSGTLAATGFWLSAVRVKLGCGLLLAGVVPIAVAEPGNVALVSLTVLAVLAGALRAWRAHGSAGETLH